MLDLEVDRASCHLLQGQPMPVSIPWTDVTATKKSHHGGWPLSFPMRYLWLPSVLMPQSK